MTLMIDTDSTIQGRFLNDAEQVLLPRYTDKAAALAMKQFLNTETVSVIDFTSLVKRTALIIKTSDFQIGDCIERAITLLKQDKLETISDHFCVYFAHQVLKKSLPLTLDQKQIILDQVKANHASYKDNISTPFVPTDADIQYVIDDMAKHDPSLTAEQVREDFKALDELEMSLSRYASHPEYSVQEYWGKRSRPEILSSHLRVIKFGYYMSRSENFSDKPYRITRLSDIADNADILSAFTRSYNIKAVCMKAWLPSLEPRLQFAARLHPAPVELFEDSEMFEASFTFHKTLSGWGKCDPKSDKSIIEDNSECKTHLELFDACQAAAADNVTDK